LSPFQRVFSFLRSRIHSGEYAPDDITNNAYIFSISFDDLINNAKFSNALYSSSNIFGASTEGAGDSERRYVTPNQGQTSASFVIAFDFSQAGYEITGFSINDSLYINNNAVRDCA
jgi:hypothetical protein